MRSPERIVLQGRYVRLEPLDERHRDDLLSAAAQDPATFRYMSSDLSVGAGAWPAYLADALAPDFVAWATVDAATGRAVGSTRFGDIAPEHGRVEIGWTWIAPSHQRTAVNTEAKLLQLAYAFDELGATRVALKTDGRNLRSQAAIERLGAVREGAFRRHIRMPDGFMRDTVYYSILADEWPSVKAKLEARLERPSDRPGQATRLSDRSPGPAAPRRGGPPQGRGEG
jgi:RimJ/RimL family protein N-acetyltransferase